MKVLHKERMRLRRAYLSTEGRRIPQLLKTREFMKTSLPLMPWLVGASVDAKLSVQVALLMAGMLLTLAWFGFVLWTLEAVSARRRDKHDLRVGRFLLPDEYSR